MISHKKVAYFLSHPIQYFSPMLKLMAKKMDLEVYYFSDSSVRGALDKGFGQAVQWDTPLLEGYLYHFIKNYSSKQTLNNNFGDVFNPGVIRILWKSKADVVIVNGWTYSSTLMCILFGRLFGKKIWVRAENPLNQELLKSRKVLFLKKIILKHLLFRFFVSRCLYIGKENRAFFEYYGVKAKKLIYTPYSVNNDFFKSNYEKIKYDLESVRVRLGLPLDKKLILFSGKYIPKKRPMDILQAFAQLNSGAYALVMMGEGMLRKEMEEYIAQKGLSDVYLTGFVNQSKVSEYYAVVDVYVMCSGIGETWGLSVNEAMNFEKPVIVSKTSGCSADLVHHGENGFVFEEGNVKELAECLQKVLENEAFRINAGLKSGTIVREYSIDKIVEQIEEELN